MGSRAIISVFDDNFEGWGISDVNAILLERTFIGFIEAFRGRLPNKLIR